MCFSVQFGMNAECVSVHNLGQMLGLFQCSVWELCCVCFSYNLERMLCAFQCSVWDGC